MRKFLMILIISGLIFQIGCRPGFQNYDNDPEIQQSIDNYEIKVSTSAKIPNDGSGPVAGFAEYPNPDQIVTFTSLDERIFVEDGKTVNFIYEGIDPDDTYVMYESWDNGYYLTLKNKYDGVNVKFAKLCQLFIVGNPSLTRIAVPPSMKYEQIIWTPREDGTWELRIGTTERGCKSKALDQLQKVRTRDYEKNLPK